jgi:hypothetical protein
MRVTLQLILQGTKIGNEVLRLPFGGWGLPEQHGLQSTLLLTFGQWPTHSCCRCCFQVVMDGALAHRTSPGDLPLSHFEFEA